MKNKKCILLITACIAPPEVNLRRHFINRADPIQRLHDYQVALKYWLRYDEPLIKGIVFVENSESDLSTLEALVRHHNTYKREVEFLQYKAGEIPEGLHYGYSELEMIDNAFKNSKLISDCDFIIKVTGRLFFPKLSKLLQKVVPSHLFIADSRDFKILKISKHYILTTLFIVRKDFFERELFDAKKIMKQNNRGLIETIYFEIIKPIYLKQKANIVLRFPFNVEPVGVGAHWNVDYSSYKKKIPALLRQVSRRLIPNFWI